MTFGTGVLQVGSTGAAVTELQQWLITKGFLIAMTAPTGTFDAATDQGVKAFQLSAGIACDGQVGNGTRTAADAYTGTALTGGWHPTAVRDVQQTSIGGAFATTTRRGILHTTEGTSLPSYPNPPHFTVGRDGGAAAQLWQHYPVTVAARALANPSGPPETNTWGAIQIEVIGSAANSPTMATTQPDSWRSLGEVMRWIEANASVASSTAVTFDGEAAYGLSGTVRLDVPTWEASTGWLGHQHVPQNSHWDPGQIDIAALLLLPAAGTATAPATPPAPAPAPASSPWYWPFSADTPPALAAPLAPTVRATTRALSNAFPSLTLAVDPAGLPWFEVILTTSAELFAADRQHQRTPDNFYASRQDGLRRSEDAHGRYIAPVGVVAGFARANPGGGRIHYTVVGYADENGSGAVLAAPPEVLAHAAASIVMLPGFQGHTRTQALGVPLGMLTPAVRGAATALGLSGRLGGPGATATGQQGGYAAVPDPAAPDRLEGEDGCDLRIRQSTPARVPTPVSPPQAPARPGPAAVVSPTMPAPAPVPFSPASDPVEGERPGVPESVVPVATPAVFPPPPAASTDPAGLGADWYDDGWGEWGAAGRPRNLSDDERAGPDDEFDDLGYAGQQPAAPSPAGEVTVRPAAAHLEPETKRAIIETFVGQDTDLYSAVSVDAEFAGGAGTDHPAYQRWHAGLGFGIVGFSQDSGDLGQLLTLMEQRDTAKFAEIFGPDAPALLEVTNRPGPLGKDVADGRSVRVQPVAGADIWVNPWLERFHAAGAQPAFRGAQIELASGLYLDPVLRFCSDLGLATPRGLAIVFDRSAHRGATGGMNWVCETVGPLQTDTLREAALRSIGMSSVEEFQRSQPDLLVDDQFGSITHAALTGVLRMRAERGNASPVPIMGYQPMVEALGRRATGQPWGDRIVRLVGDAAVGDSLQQVAVAG